MILERNWACIFWLASALLEMAAVPTPIVQAATFVIINNDSPGQGLNDPTPATPVGGNTGTSLGAQRLIAFQYAADFWGARLSSSVTIQVGATFTPLTCSSTSAVLGSAGPNTFFRDFTGAPVVGTWYPVALANALNGSDLDPSNPDITAQFNSSIGTTCPFPKTWYYGLDGNPPGGQIDFVTVLLHELAHGLGFLTIVDLASGSKALGFNDTFMLNLIDQGASPLDYPSMTDAQRVAASVDTGNLQWVGANVRALSGILTAGSVGDHVRMFAPNPQQPGSSVSHWDQVLAPNQLLEPVYTGPLHNPILEPALFKDIGWTVLPSPLVAAVLPTSRSAQPGGTVTAFATVINSGSTPVAGCSIGQISGLPSNFLYQTTNPQTNALTGSANTPVSIGAGASQSFLIALTPSATFAPVNALFAFGCTNVPMAPIFIGLNTLLLSASTTSPTPDIIALGATPKNDGIVHVTGTPSQGFFAVASDNLGSTDTIVVSTNTGRAVLPLMITICQSNPATGVCLQTPSATVTTTIASNATPTFVIFVSASGAVPFDPANSRIFVAFTDSTNAVRGETSVAVETQ
jgi:hypothetical protein